LIENFNLRFSLVQIYQNQLPTILLIKTLLGNQFLLTTLENQSIDFYIQLVPFISKINIQCKNSARVWRSSRTVKNHTKFILVQAFWRATSSFFATLAKIPLTNQKLHEKHKLNTQSCTLQDCAIHPMQRPNPQLQKPL